MIVIQDNSDYINVSRLIKKSKCEEGTWSDQTKTKSKSKYEADTWSDQAAPLSREERRGRGGRKSPWESGAPPRGGLWSV